MKIVINTCYGGFSISKECAKYMASKGHIKVQLDLKESTFCGGYSYDRTDPILIEAVETLGKKADGSFARLSIIEIPDDVDYYIDDYDGMESIHEQHRTWG